MKKLLVLLLLPLFLVACKDDNKRDNTLAKLHTECQAKGGTLQINPDKRGYECIVHVKKTLGTFHKWCDDESGEIEMDSSTKSHIACDWDDGSKRGNNWDHDMLYQDYLVNDGLKPYPHKGEKHLGTFDKWCRDSGGRLRAGHGIHVVCGWNDGRPDYYFKDYMKGK